MRTISRFNYKGPSMKPLLRPGDGLIVDPSIPFTSLRKGDVICFKTLEKSIHVTHRVVAVIRNGLITCGENNTKNDPYVITAEQNPLLVTHIRRGRSTIKIDGGKRGMLIHHKNRLRYFILRRTIPLLIILLERVIGSRRDNGSLRYLTLIEKNLSAIQYRRNGKEIWMLFAGKQRIGYQKSDGTWYVKIPWRFFIDPQKLTRKHKEYALST